MLIIGTTSMSSNLEDLGVIAAFDRIIHVPNLGKNEIMNVLKNYDCDDTNKEKIVNLVQGITIKQLCLIIDRALQKSSKLIYENFASEYRDYTFK
jgi:hypothetical protein